VFVWPDGSYYRLASALHMCSVCGVPLLVPLARWGVLQNLCGSIEGHVKRNYYTEPC
jgi:hypothetical protein